MFKRRYSAKRGKFLSVSNLKSTFFWVFASVRNTAGRLCFTIFCQVTTGVLQSLVRDSFWFMWWGAVGVPQSLVPRPFGGWGTPVSGPRSLSGEGGTQPGLQYPPPLARTGVPHPPPCQVRGTPPPQPN